MAQENHCPQCGAELPDNAHAAPSQGCAHGDLATPRLPLDNVHIGQIQAGDTEQSEASANDQCADIRQYKATV